MNRIIFILIICEMLVSSCQDKQSHTVKADDINLKAKVCWLEKFSLPVNAGIEIDSTSFVFFKSKSFDTSFLLQLQIKDSIIKGVYYEVLPSYHRNINDYLDASSNLIAFEGMSFKVSPLDWAKITDSSRLIPSSDSADLKNEKVCLDCPFYFLSYNDRTVVSVNKNEGQFEKYVDFLNNNLIYKLKKYRKPILIESK